MNMTRKPWFSLAFAVMLAAFVSTFPIPNYEARAARATKRSNLALVLPAVPARKESLRGELIRLQKETGLSLVAVGRGAVGSIVFAERALSYAAPFLRSGADWGGTVSPDGAEIAFPRLGRTLHASFLGIVRQDGSDLREYSDFRGPSSICWSYDKSKLAMDGAYGLSGDGSLKIFNVSPPRTQEVDTHATSTSQCWSPDGKQVVYDSQAGSDSRHNLEITVQVYDIEQKRSRVLARGAGPTWSPDGKWIAFSDGDAYYAIDPFGNGRRLLFKATDAEFGLSGLWWSPDSRFVAYISYRGVFERPPWMLMTESSRLRVRRLDDNSEIWVANLGEHDPRDFQWVSSGKPNSR